jgi:hypothetical protein
VNLELLKYITGHAGSGLLPVMSMIHVYEGNTGRRAQVGNGRYVVDVPTDLPVCTVAADRLLAAWQACKGEPSASLTEHHLMLRAGRVRARIALSDPAAYPRTRPVPKGDHRADGVAALLKRLQPFVATDASKPWATSLCLKGGYAYATNNVVLLRAPFTADLPGVAVNLPSSVFDAIIAKGEPTEVTGTENALTFYFDDDTWIQTQLVQGEWPTATVDNFVEHAKQREWETPHADLGLMLATAAKVSESRIPIIEFVDDGLCLSNEGTFEADDLMPVPAKGRMNARMAALVFEHATRVQWHMKSDIHGFMIGDDIFGVFGGMR